MTVCNALVERVQLEHIRELSPPNTEQYLQWRAAGLVHEPFKPFTNFQKYQCSWCQKEMNLFAHSWFLVRDWLGDLFWVCGDCLRANREYRPFTEVFLTDRYLREFKAADDFSDFDSF